jgi:hypothetical protein
MLKQSRLNGDSNAPEFNKNYLNEGLRNFLPSVAAGLGASAYQFFNAEPENVSYERVNSDLVDLTRARTALKRNANSSYNILNNYVGRNAISGGNAMSNLSAGAANLNNQLGAGLSKSYLDEQVQNTGIRNKDIYTNAATSRLETDANIAERDAAQSIKDQAMYQGAAYTQQYMQDVNNYVNQQDIIGSMGGDNYSYEYVPGSKTRRKVFIDRKNGVKVFQDDKGRPMIFDYSENRYLTPEEYKKRKNDQ